MLLRRAGDWQDLGPRLVLGLRRWWGLGVLLLAFVVSIGTTHGYRQDEPAHAAFTVHLAEHPTWDSIRTYEGSRNYEAKGPFLFLVGAAWGSAFGMNLLNLRILSLLFGILGVVLFAKLVEASTTDPPPGAATAIVVLPYFSFLALTYHTDVASLALGLAAILGYSRNVEVLRLASWVGAVAATSALLWTRIDAAVIPAAVGLACLLRGPLPRAPGPLGPWLGRVPARLWIGLALPFLLLLPLLVAWGDFLPPSARNRPIPLALRPTPSNLSFGLCVVGLLFAPFALRGFDRSRSTWLVAAAGLGLFLAFPVVFEAEGQGDRFLGLLRSASLATGLPGGIIQAALAALCVSGVLALRTILQGALRAAPAAAMQAVAVLLTLLALVARGPVIFERYLLPVTALLMVLSTRVPMGTGWRTLWLAGLACLSLAHLLRSELISFG